MGESKYIYPLNEADEKVVHGGSVKAKILLNDVISGTNNFSFLVNTMTAGLNCDQTGTGHSHGEEHCMFTLSGSGGVSINGEKYPLEPQVAVYIPPGAMHFVWADPGEDFTYVIVYSPGGPEKDL